MLAERLLDGGLRCLDETSFTSATRTRHECKSERSHVAFSSADPIQRAEAREADSPSRTVIDDATSQDRLDICTVIGIRRILAYAETY